MIKFATLRLVFVLIFLPLALLLLPYLIIEILRDKCLRLSNSGHLLPTIRQMKRQEEKNKFFAMQKVLFESEIIEPEFIIDEPASLVLHYKRELIVELSKLRSYRPSWIPFLTEWSIPPRLIDEVGSLDYKALLQTGLNQEPALLAALESLLFYPDGKTTPYALELSSAMCKRKLWLRKLSLDRNRTEEFQDLLHEMIDLLQKPEKAYENPTQANRRFIHLYRKLLKHPVYALNKYDTKSPYVNLLHRFAYAIWNDVHILNEYKAIGQAILKDLESETKTTPSSVEKELPAILSASQTFVSESYYTNDHSLSKLRYTCTHLRNAMGTLAAEGGILRMLPKLLGIEEYDSHGTLSNNPSLQGNTAWKGPSIHGSINNCYGGTPTIGDHRIAPEFEALLQMVENNVLNPQRGSGALTQVIYNNLQNIDKDHGEGPRSRTLMQLNTTYPLSFRGTILAKDSSLFLMKSPSDVVWEDSRQFGKILKEKLFLGINSQGTQGHGYYFSGSSEKWKTIFDAVVDCVSVEFSAQRAISDDEKSSLQGAFQEYVYALLISVIECRTLYELNLAGIQDPLVMSLTACKENIDRGGMENMKYMYLRLPFNETDKPCISSSEQTEYLVGVMNSRSLSVRDRAILKNRMSQTLSFIELVTPDRFHRTLTELLEKLNIPAKMAYTPDQKH